MTSTTAAVTPTVAGPKLAGQVCFWSALAGAASALLVILFPPAVGPEHYSYPFTPSGYRVAQIFFFVQHLGLVVGLVGLLRSPLTRHGKLARVGLWIAVAGYIALALTELLAIAAAEASTDSGVAGLVNSVYGIPMTFIGVGLVLAGIDIARARTLTGWPRWLTLALGVYVFVVLFPAVFGPHLLGRLAIGVWMLMFAGLGLVLMRSSRN